MMIPNNETPSALVCILNKSVVTIDLKLSRRWSTLALHWSLYWARYALLLACKVTHKAEDYTHNLSPGQTVLAMINLVSDAPPLLEYDYCIQWIILRQVYHRFNHFPCRALE